MAAGRAAAAAGRLAAGAAAGRLAAFVGRLSPAGLVSRRNACTEVDLKKVAALTEEISKVLKESPSEMAPPKIRGLVEELSKACGHPSIENWRHFSTGGREPADKAESLLHTWWKRARDRVENADSVDKDKAVFAYGVVVIGTPTLYLLNWTRKWF